MRNPRAGIMILFVLVLLIIAAAVLFVPRHGIHQIRMASLLPLDGQVSAYGDMMRNGATLAAEDINASAAKGTKVDIQFFNTSHKKDVALDRLKEADQKGIKFIVEIFGSDQVEHCLEYARKANMIVLSGVDTRPDLVQKGQNTFFRIMPNDAAASSAIVEWAKELGLKRLSVLYADDAWGNGLREAAESAASRLGLEVVGKHDLSRNQPSYTATVSSVRTSSPDAVLMFVYPDDGGNFLKEAKRQGLKAKYFATENFTGTTMVQSAKDAADGVMLVVPSSTAETPEFRSFQDRYKTRFGADPTVFSFKAYDAVRVLYDVAVTAKGSATAAREAIKRYKAPGLGGDIAFDEKGEFIPSPYARQQFVKDGGSYLAKPVSR